ncbi:ABC transporter substrate-binding protein [Thalassospira profundimaris]|uniref:ABC transporter substrate-binding protein n=2 Tax=Thalassospira TaxID=168934 RepID=A0A367WBJ2_9PROT|nr:ABC transporter substrate-binding protein [Thalassospira profundimaris]
MLFAPALVRADHVLVITTNIYPPYVHEDVDHSFLPALFFEIGKIMGISFDIRIQPWKRGEQSVSDLEAWGTFPYTRNNERKITYSFSDPLYFSDSRFFAYRNPSKTPHVQPPETYEELTDLRRWSIGGIQGYYYEPLFAETGIEADYALSEKQNFERLQLGRIDLFPAATTVGWYLVRELFPPEIAANFYTLDPPLSARGALHLMTSKDYPDNDILLAKFNAALAEIRQNGIYTQLVDKFGLVMHY